MLHVGLQSDDMRRESRRVWGTSLLRLPFSLSDTTPLSLTRGYAFSHTLCPLSLSLTFADAQPSSPSSSPPPHGMPPPSAYYDWAVRVSLAVGSALILPMTLLAFIRPVPLPYSWAAPPEPLSLRTQSSAASSSSPSVSTTRRPSPRRSRRYEARRVHADVALRHVVTEGSRTSGRRSGADRYSAGSSPGGLVGPSLHL